VCVRARRLRVGFAYLAVERIQFVRGDDGFDFTNGLDPRWRHTISVKGVS